jgi:hypothetical protein
MKLGIASLLAGATALGVGLAIGKRPSSPSGQPAPEPSTGPVPGTGSTPPPGSRDNPQIRLRGGNL